MGDPTRIVADADVLAADLLVGGDARAALDHVRRHDWLTPVASEPLLADAHAVIADLATADKAGTDGGGADETLADDWLARVRAEWTLVDHPGTDHPALGAAYRGDAGHLLTFDDRLGSPAAGLALKPAMDCSVRTPAAFDRVFDAKALYEATQDEASPDEE